MAVQPIPTTQVIQNSRAVINDKFAQAKLKRITARLGTTDTVQKVFTATNKFGLVLAETGVKVSPRMAALTSEAGNAARLMVVPYLPTALDKANSSWEKLNTPNIVEGEGSRKMLNATADTANLAAASFCAANLVMTSPGMNKAASAFKLVADSATAVMNASDVQTATAMISYAAKDATVSKDLVEALEATKMNKLLMLAKNVLSVAVTIFGLAAFAMGGAPLLPSLALVTMSLASAILAIVADLHRDASKYKMVDFFKHPVKTA